MRSGLRISGLVCLALAIVPNAVILSVLQSSDAVEALATGTFLLRGSLAVLGLYLLVIAQFAHIAPTGVGSIYSDPAPRSAHLVLLAILAIAAALRFYSLGTGIWFDEMLMHVGYMALEPLRVLTHFNDANNHILYTFLARLSLEAFGDTVSAIRLPAVLFGIASIAAIYAFARRVMTWQEALVAAGLLTVSFHHIWFSQNARGYTALLFFALVSSTFLIDAIRTGHVWRWMAYALAGALGAYTHLTIGFLFIGHFIYVAAAASMAAHGRPLFWTALGFGFVPLGLLTITLYAIVLPDIVGGALLATGLQEDSEWTNPIWAIREFIGSLSTGFSGAGVLIAGAFVTAVGMISFLRRDWAPVAFLAIPCGLAALLMTSIGYTLFPRFFFFAMGFGVIVVVHGAAVIGRLVARVLSLRSPLAEWIAIAPALLLIAGSVMSLQYVYFPKQNYAASIDFLEGRLEPGDAVAVVGVAELPYLVYHGKEWTHVESAAEIEELLASHERVWTIYTLPVQFAYGHPDIAALLQERFRQEEVFYSSLGGGEIVVSVSDVGASGDRQGSG